MADDFNLNAYRKKEQVEIYANQEYIFKAEEMIFSAYCESLKKSDVLDIGVGGGRTTKLLYPLCKTYLGIDYSVELVDACNTRFNSLPPNTIINYDARNIEQLNKKFDFICFSFNGIDYMGHEDRIKFLQSVYRTLNPNSFFFFSSHSLCHYPFKHDHVNQKNANVNLFEAKARGWEMLIDYASEFITYYIDPRLQILQLQAAGFEVYEILDSEGVVIKLLSPDPDKYMFHYLARKTL
jgi:SAM-dependent methyltransferase